MIHLDTSALIAALTRDRPALPVLRRFIGDGNRLAVCGPVLYEWWQGPRTAAELDAQERLFPSESTVAFGHVEAAIAEALYRTVKRPRGREIDLAIAACAIAQGAALWTLNPQDFADLPDLTVIRG